MTISEAKKILEKNNSILQRVEAENWAIRYNKETDMFIVGGNFPVDSFYSYVEGKEIMIRLDKENKIYGFAIENARYFIKDKPDFAYAMYPIIHPLRAKIVFKLAFGMSKFMGDMSKIGSAIMVKDYLQAA